MGLIDSFGQKREQLMIYKINTLQITFNIKENLEQVNSPERAYLIAKEIYKSLDADQEHMTLLALDAKNQIRGYKVINSGGQNSADPDMRIIFRNALLLGACGIILVHNHPSGDPTPSIEDKTFTDKVKEAGELLQISLLDHIILGAGIYHSFEGK